MSDNDQKPPTPEEVSKKLADFMKSNFGRSMGFSAFGDDLFGTDDGGKDDEILEVYARTLVKQPVKSAAFASCELLSTGRPATGSSVADSTAR